MVVNRTAVAGLAVAITSITDPAGTCSVKRAGVPSALLVPALIIAGVIPASAASDWGVGPANAKIPANNIFTPVSTPAVEIDHLAIFVLAVCGAIFLVVGGLLLYVLIRYRSRPADDAREPAQVYGSNPIEFAWTTVPVMIVFVLIMVTARTVYSIKTAPEPKDALRVTVVGHQWWWEFRYPGLGIVTANELHVPLSNPAHPTPTFLTLESADVDHSFWVPRLAGKTDVIPNHINHMWIDPHVAGSYFGQCAEFCGTEHALMLFRVIVQPRAQFERWAANQEKPAEVDPATARGRRIFENTACINCHTVRGTDAHGVFGPDLTHLMSRTTIGAGAALLDPANLKTWVRDPNEIKPGVRMPAMKLGPHQLNALVAYLESLH